MDTKSVPTRGRTLDYAAFVYDLFEPILLLGKQVEYNRRSAGCRSRRGFRQHRCDGQDDSSGQKKARQPNQIIYVIS